MNKRGLDMVDDHNKKNIDEITKQALENNDWPIYNHPNGGLIKITPWGSIREFQLNGEKVTKFEDMNFSDYDFTNLPLPYNNNSKHHNNYDSNHHDNNNDMHIDTSFNRNLNSMNSMNSLTSSTSNTNFSYNNGYELPQTPQSIRLSPCDEAENYVIQGYEGENVTEYGKEQENYFGMMDDEENEHDN